MNGKLSTQNLYTNTLTALAMSSVVCWDILAYTIIYSQKTQSCECYHKTGPIIMLLNSYWPLSWSLFWTNLNTNWIYAKAHTIWNIKSIHLIAKQPELMRSTQNTEQNHCKNDPNKTKNSERNTINYDHRQYHWHSYHHASPIALFNNSRKVRNTEIDRPPYR